MKFHNKDIFKFTLTLADLIFPPLDLSLVNHLSKPRSLFVVGTTKTDVMLSDCDKNYKDKILNLN